MKVNKYLTFFLALFVLMVTVTPTGAAENTSNVKKVILQMTTTLENSDTQLHFNYAENLGDGRGITFGCIGFCTGTYDGNILIKHYTELNPDNTLAKYIPALNKIDAGSHNAAGGDGNPNVEGLSGFIKDVQSCNDPLFKTAQIDKLDELYYNPAMKIADSIGAKNALTKAFIYDMCVRHGVDGAERIIKNAGTTPKQGADENAYLQKLISLRDSKLKQEGLGDVNRDQGYKNVLNSGNVNLQTPFKFVAYGESFTIDGSLDLGEQQQETTDEEEDNSSEDVIIEAGNRLREASPDIVYKSSSFIDVGGMNSVRYRDIMLFNLSEYTNASQIGNATLSLYWYYPEGSTRPQDTIVEVYRPASSWNANYVSWNKRDKNVAWNNAGGDWYDKNGILQGSTPYATFTIKGSSIPDNRYYQLNVTDLVKEYVSGKYENTGFLIKARSESNNYIAFYSSDWTNENQKPKLNVTEEAASVIVPEPDVNATVTDVKDNRLREASPEIVYQDSSFIDVGGISDVGRYRDVMWFNLSEHNSSEVSNATLSLYWYYPEGSSRAQDTIIEVYRPASSWNPAYVSWNKKDKGIAWNNAGGDWYDKNGVAQGSTPYAILVIKGSELPDNRYHQLDVTNLVKEYASGKYENTGFLIKARTESSNYIAFYSSDWTNENQKPKLNVTKKVSVTPTVNATLTGATDNRLREASPDIVYKSSSFIDAGGMNNVRYRDMMWFNLSEYTGSTEVSNAILSLYWYYPAGTSRPNDTIIEIYRPASSWNANYVSWNKRDKNVAWKNSGGDWYDKNGVSQGSIPYATITIKGSSLPDNKYHQLNVTDLVKEYVSGKYENTGFLIKARTESNNYVAFYSNDCGNESQVPKLQLVYS